MRRIWGALFGRSEIDEWRDDWTHAATVALRQLADDLGPVVDTLAMQASKRALFLSPGHFLMGQVAPAIAAAAEPGAALLVAQAETALREVAGRRVCWPRGAVFIAPGVPAFDAWSDAALAGAAIAVEAVAAEWAHDRFVARLRRQGREHVARVLVDGTAKEPSRLQHLTRLFAQVAAETKKV